MDGSSDTRTLSTPVHQMDFICPFYGSPLITQTRMSVGFAHTLPLHSHRPKYDVLCIVLHVWKERKLKLSRLSHFGECARPSTNTEVLRFMHTAYEKSSSTHCSHECETHTHTHTLSFMSGSGSMCRVYVYDVNINVPRGGVFELISLLRIQVRRLIQYSKCQNLYFIDAMCAPSHITVAATFLCGSKAISNSV